MDLKYPLFIQRKQACRGRSQHQSRQKDHFLQMLHFRSRRVTHGHQPNHQRQVKWPTVTEHRKRHIQSSPQNSRRQQSFLEHHHQPLLCLHTQACRKYYQQKVKPLNRSFLDLQQHSRQAVAQERFPHHPNHTRLLEDSRRFPRGAQPQAFHR